MLVGGGRAEATLPPPHTHTHSLAGSPTTNAKKTAHYFPDSSMLVTYNIYINDCMCIKDNEGQIFSLYPSIIFLFFLYIFLAGWSVLATPLRMSPTLYGSEP
jgi:hypothetical protein